MLSHRCTLCTNKTTYEYFELVMLNFILDIRVEGEMQPIFTEILYVKNKQTKPE